MAVTTRAGAVSHLRARHGVTARRIQRAELRPPEGADRLALVTASLPVTGLSVTAVAPVPVAAGLRVTAGLPVATTLPLAPALLVGAALPLVVALPVGGGAAVPVASALPLGAVAPAAPAWNPISHTAL